MLKKLLGLLVIGFSLNSYAADVNPEISKKITQGFKTSLPSINVEDISASPISDLYQITSGPIIVYATKDGKYAISGDILDLSDGKTNITENARKVARVSALDSIQDSMIVFSAKSPKTTVTVFTDIDCGYCRKFHKDMDRLNELGVTVRYLSFPRAGLQSASYEKAANVWCANDRNSAITSAKQGEHIKDLKCASHKVDEQFNLGVQAGITGTPTIIFEDGSVVPGYLPPEKILEVAQSTN